jgi:MFS family permease
MNSNDKRNFAGGIWHGAFLALGNSLTRPTTVLSAFIAELTGSTVWVGGLSTLLTVAGTLPQIFVARWLEPKPRKMPYLMTAIYLRVASWGVLAWLIHRIGADRPDLLVWALVVLLVIFYAGGGLGNVPFTDIVGKVIPLPKRGAFFGGRQALAGPLSIGAALLAKRILEKTPYPDNYALLFGLAAALLAIASLGFWVIREPDSVIGNPRPQPWAAYWQDVARAARILRPLVITELLTGFSLMVLPFYVVFAKENLGAPLAAATGWYLTAQVGGGVLSNFLWARLVDRYNSRTMLFYCALTAAVTPLLAIFLGQWGWRALLPVFFLAGSTFNGRRVGFQTALLELAPDAQRGTYAGINALLSLPIAFLPLVAGALLKIISYPALFTGAALFIGLGALAARRLPVTKSGLSDDKVVKKQI